MSRNKAMINGEVMVIVRIKCSNNIDESFSKKYDNIRSVYTIQNFFKKLEGAVSTIKLIHITFNTLDTRSNFNEINKLSAAIISSKLFVSYCNHHKSRVLVYDELHDDTKQFNIIISNKKFFKNSDCHIYIHNREHYYNERTYLADP
jgi:hypothetical protein